MSYINITDLELFGDTVNDNQVPIQQPDWIQDFNGFDFDTSFSSEKLPAGADSFLGSPFEEHPRGSQQLGWQSPPASEYGESLQGGSEEVVWYADSAVEDLSAQPSVQDPAAENARLKAMVVAMSERLTQLENAAAPKTPSQAQFVRLPITPRKRAASRIEDLASPPSKRSSPMTPRSIGPIEAMWSPGVTPEQRRAIYESEMKSSASPAIGMSSPGSTKGHQTSISSPAATLHSTPTLKRKAAVKKARVPRAKKTPAPKKVTAPKVRPINELYELNFSSLNAQEKASILLPLLEGIDPFTGTRSAPVPMRMDQETPATPATTTPTKDDMTAADFNTLINYTAGNDSAFNFGQFGHFDNIDGATRQREALEKHERRMAEGLRR